MNEQQAPLVSVRELRKHYPLNGGLLRKGAAVKAVEAVDACVETVWEAVRDMGGYLFLTADHGNADKMENPDGTPFTAHTTNPVPFLVAGCGNVKLRAGGCLADIAPTMLQLLQIRQPAEMTGSSLLNK